MSIHSFLAMLAAWCSRRALLVVFAGLLLSGGSILLAANRLGVSTDTDQLFSDSLPWKQRAAELARQFPQFDDQIVAVVDGDTPEQADQTAAQLAAALSADHAHFNSVTRPDASPFLEQEGLLFLKKDELTGLLNQTIDAQPFLGQLVADPSARGLFSALSLVAMGVQQGQANLAPFDAPLRGFDASLAASVAGHPKPLSWERLLSGSLADLQPPYRFVLTQPVLNHGALQPGGEATAALRTAAAKLEFVRDGSAHVHITGSVPLADEEFATVAEGAVAGLVGSAVLVVFWLFLAVHSWRLIVPIVLTLMIGLLLTTGFAALAVGTLNLISVAFAILFVGIAVDFSIQFSVRFREARLFQPEIQDALATTAGRVGVQLLVAATATAAGFLAFVPTSFSGVAELGLISGVGMLIAFVCTLTFLPATLSLFRPHGEKRPVGFTALAVIDRSLARLERPVLTVFGAIGVVGIALIPMLRFDADPLHTKNPNTEAMRTLAQLMDNPVTNPFTISIMRPSVAEAGAVADDLSKLPLVGQTMSLLSFVPDDQPAKLALIADAAGILSPTLSASPSAAPVTVSDLRLAVRHCLDQIEQVLPKLPANAPLAHIAADLRKLSTAPDATLLAMNTALTRFLPLQLERLRKVLAATPVTAASIPPEIARNWVLPDGRARAEIVPKANIGGGTALRAFVEQVQAKAPDAGGSAVTIVATSETITSAFRNAAIGALVAIAAILLIALRRLLDMALVMAPLLLATALTVLVAVLLPLPLNFANIIALPLLLGLGVSFNIYFVMNWRGGEMSRLASPTARAVIFSALTTGTAFGSLAISAHPGTASMGMLLLLSLACTLVATLAFVPALLSAIGQPKT
jgi:uncharacterized protein